MSELSEGEADEGGDWVRGRLPDDVGLRRMDLDADAEEDLVVLRVVLPLVLGRAVDGRAAALRPPKRSQFLALIVGSSWLPAGGGNRSEKLGGTERARGGSGVAGVV